MFYALIVAAIAALAALPLRLAGQERPRPVQNPAPADSTALDTLAPLRLADVNVTVARGHTSSQLSPFAVGAVSRAELRRNGPTRGLEGLLQTIPGVVVANRANYSLDQRITIRGFGARASFGMRGLKVLLDGVPQTLPDGQSQLTNLELDNLEAIEVLRGSSSSLHGNASGGVISLRSALAAPEPFVQRLRVESGGGHDPEDSFIRWHSWSSGRHGPLSGTLSISRFATDGSRHHSAADLRQLHASLHYLLSGSTAATLRVGAADTPRAQNPGALTFEEYQADPAAAAPNNLLRGADKAVRQQQLSLGLQHYGAGGNEYAATAFALWRTLRNPIAAPPDGGTPGPDAGTHISVDRSVGGTRLTGTRTWGMAAGQPRLTYGIDAQRMHDDRTERQSAGGEPTATILVDQSETVTEIGPFLQATWTPIRRLLLNAGARYDWVRFRVDDHHTADGADDTGGRTMGAPSANVGLSWRGGEGLIPYANLSTSFETPTTTELKNRPDGTGGFNAALGPQRAVNYEVGARGWPAPWLHYTAALFLGRLTDALVPAEDIGGRTYYRNAGRVHHDGAEVGLTVVPSAHLMLQSAYTFAHYRFREYQLWSGADGDASGHQLPGVPAHYWHVGLRTALPNHFQLSADHTLSSQVAADDANTLYAPGWGAGVTNLRVEWRGRLGAIHLAPFIGANNLWDRRYIGAVTLNGFGGRVFEPAPGRTIYLGGDIEYRMPR